MDTAKKELPDEGAVEKFIGDKAYWSEDASEYKKKDTDKLPK